MEPIFVLPYPEYAVILELQKYFKKNDGYSICLPSSRTQKGFDIILYKQDTKKGVTFQVKGSRTYIKNREDLFRYDTWFKKFDIKNDKYSDYYILFGVYLKTLINKKIDKSKKASKWYSHILLVFRRKEMEELLDQLKTKKGKPESSFSIAFSNPEQVFLTRGVQGKAQEKTKHLLCKKNELVKEIKKMLN